MTATTLRSEGAIATQAPPRPHAAAVSRRAAPKVLVVSSSFPYPVDIGRKVVIAGFLDYLATTFAPTNVTFAYLASADDPPDRAATPVNAVPLPLDRLAGRVTRVTWHSLMHRRYALQESLLYSPRAAARLKEIMRFTAPDLVVVDTVRMARYFEEQAFSGRMVLYLDDLYSLRYRRMLAAMAAHPELALDSIGTFARFIPRGLGRLVRSEQVQRRLLAFESDLIEKREGEMPDRFDEVLLLNREEAEHLSQRSRSANIATVKPLLHGHRGRLKRQFRGHPTYLFLGNLAYPANAYSLSLFMAQVMPRLIQEDRRSRLIVIGRKSGIDRLPEARRLDGHVQFLDFVEDLAPLMSTAAAMVLPLIYGSGLKMKVLDALYYGVPLVATPIGLDGIPHRPGTDCLVAADPTAFVDPLLQLLDADANLQMSEAAQNLYAQEFAPEVVRNEYAAIFGTAERAPVGG